MHFWHSLQLLWETDAVCEAVWHIGNNSCCLYQATGVLTSCGKSQLQRTFIDWWHFDECIAVTQSRQLTIRNTCYCQAAVVQLKFDRDVNNTCETVVNTNNNTLAKSVANTNTNIFVTVLFTVSLFSNVYFFPRSSINKVNRMIVFEKMAKSVQFTVTLC